MVLMVCGPRCDLVKPVDGLLLLEAIRMSDIYLAFVAYLHLVPGIGRGRIVQQVLVGAVVQNMLLLLLGVQVDQARRRPLILVAGVRARVRIRQGRYLHNAATRGRDHRTDPALLDRVSVRRSGHKAHMATHATTTRRNDDVLLDHPPNRLGCLIS